MIMSTPIGVIQVNYGGETMIDYRDVKEILNGRSEENAKVPDRIDSDTGEKIPAGMPMWRWRRRRQRREKCSKDNG